MLSTNKIKGFGAIVVLFMHHDSLRIPNNDSSFSPYRQQTHAVPPDAAGLNLGLVGLCAPSRKKTNGAESRFGEARKAYRGIMARWRSALEGYDG